MQERCNSATKMEYPKCLLFLFLYSLKTFCFGVGRATWRMRDVSFSAPLYSHHFFPFNQLVWSELGATAPSCASSIDPAWHSILSILSIFNRSLFTCLFLFKSLSAFPGKTTDCRSLYRHHHHHFHFGYIVEYFSLHGQTTVLCSCIARFGSAAHPLLASSSSSQLLDKIYTDKSF